MYAKLATGATIVGAPAAAAAAGFTTGQFVGVAMYAVVVVKLGLARIQRRERSVGTVADGSRLRVVLISPIHNEDPAFAVASARSMLRRHGLRNISMS